MNTAADFLSRTEVNSVENLEMSTRNYIQTKAIEVKIHSSGIVEDEQLNISSPTVNLMKTNIGKKNKT